MRPKLLKPLRERSRERPDRRGHDRRAAQRRSEPRVVVIESEPFPEPLKVGDRAAERVRSAGGPIDKAVYTCACGYMFDAAVSTTVVCPHCGSGQAW